MDGASFSRAWRHRALHSLEPWDRADINMVLDEATQFLELIRRPVRKVPVLRGKTVVNLFMENSTRTRTSFELAAKRMSADAVNFSVSASSVTKGETLMDTAMTLAAMGADVVIVRHHAPGASQFISRHVDACVINAGDGMHAHPTQGLLDALTIRERLGTLDGLRVAICGDVRHSRVARSNIRLLKKFGASIVVCAPPTLIGPHFGEAFDVEVSFDVNEALKGADVVMALRIQHERLESGLLPSIQGYAERFGITAERLAASAPEAIVLHPGPLNRGVELTSHVADGERSAVLAQVESGVAVRMALLHLLLGAKQQQVGNE